MRIAKRVLLFVSVNILIVATISIVLSLLGITPSLGSRGFNLGSVAVFCLVWGFGGAFMSLALSRIMAKWMMGVQVIDPGTRDGTQRALVEEVHRLSRMAGLSVMPEVGIYESPEVNAFATGPTRNRALVAVSTGLLDNMNGDQIEGVLAHEVAHVANGDMVTMTLVQGVVNAFVMFFARAAAWAASQAVDEEHRGAVQFGVVLAVELALGMLGMVVVAWFSRHREYRADAGGAQLASPAKMIAALRGLQRIQAAGEPELVDDQRAPALASLKISASGGWLALFSTHPPLDDRIAQLEQARDLGVPSNRGYRYS